MQFVSSLPCYQLSLVTVWGVKRKGAGGLMLLKLEPEAIWKHMCAAGVSPARFPEGR